MEIVSYFRMRPVLTGRIFTGVWYNYPSWCLDIDIVAYRKHAASEEKERMRETQRPMLERGALPDAPAHRIVSERNYNRLLHTPGMKLIPDAGVCNGTICTARFERCISCRYFEPNPDYIPDFEECCKVIENRNSGLSSMNTVDTKQLDVFRAFISRAHGEHTVFRIKWSDYFEHKFE